MKIITGFISVVIFWLFSGCAAAFVNRTHISELQYLTAESSGKDPQAIFTRSDWQTVVDSNVFITPEDKVSLWLRFKIAGSQNSSGRQYLKISDSLVKKARLFRHNPGTEAKPQLLESSEAAQPLVMEVDTIVEQDAIYYLNVQPVGRITLSVKLLSIDEHIDAVMNNSIIHGAFYGVLLLAISSCLVAYLLNRAKIFFFYLQFLLALVFFQAAIDGNGLRYFWPDSVWWGERASLFWGGLCGFWLLQFFFNAVKEIRETSINKKVKPFMQLTFVLVSIIQFATNSFVLQIMLALMLIVTVVFVVILAVVFQKMHRRYSLTGAAIFMALYLAGISLQIVGISNGSHVDYFCFLPVIHILFSGYYLFKQADSRYKDLKYSQGDAQDKLEKYRSVFENAVEGLYQCDLNGRILSANRSFAKILGYDSVEDLMDNIIVISSNFYVNRLDHMRYLRLLLKNGYVREFEVEFYRKDGSGCLGENSSRLIRGGDGKPLYVDGSLIDISHRKERLLLEQQREAAIISAQSKSDFLANMSHEIRTPMNAVVGFTNLLDRSSGLSQRQRGFIEKIKLSSQSLLKIINDILDYSKLEAGMMILEKTPFDLIKIIDHTGEMFSAQFSQKGVELILHCNKDVPRYLIGDHFRLSQVLINLINNAYKFTAHGQVEVIVSTESVGDDVVMLRFDVKDSGIGIPDGKIELLFESFTQADESTTRKYGGTGLGLAISKNIVKAFSGDIYVNSVEGKGSVFTFVIPMQIDPDKEHQQQELPPELLSKQALVLDENETLRNHIKTILDEVGVKCREASSAEMALQKLISLGEAEEIDVLIMDYNIGDVCGFEFITELREESETKGIKIVLLANRPYEELTKREKGVGFNAYLRKPVKGTTLLNALIDVFECDSAYLSKNIHQKQEMPDFGDYVGKSILLVEDNVINQDLIKEMFRFTDIDIICAANGKEAVEKITADSFDLVLMDIQMPDMNGYEASKIIRDGGDETPIIALTANNRKEVREECFACGMDDFIGKPIDFEELTQKVKHWLGEEDGKAIESSDKKAVIEAEVADDRVQVLNVSSAMKKFGGNEKLFKKITNDFILKFYDGAESMEKVMESSDDELKLRTIHTIKGLSANVGGELLSEAARNLEAKLKENCQSGYDEELLRYEKEFHKYCQAVSRYEECG